MKIKPLGERILIKILKINEQSTVRRIELPQNVMFSGNAGVAEVLGVGQGYITNKKDDFGNTIWDPLETKVGEKIIFNSRAGLGLSKNYRLIRDSEVLAKISDDGVDIGEELLTGDEN